MKITTIGIDLAKNVFQIHGANEHGKPALPVRWTLKRRRTVIFGCDRNVKLRSPH